MADYYMKKIKILLVLMFVVLVGGCSCSNGECNCPDDSGSTANTETVVISDYSELYKQTVRSVVMIRVQKKNDKGYLLSTGSGVVAYEDGNRAYVYTNAHIFKGATNEYEVEIIFSNEYGVPSGAREVVKLNSVFKDPYEDTAVIEISRSNKYTLATLGNSDNLERGDWIYTIGSPLAKFNYTTSGNVSSVKSPIDLDSSGTGIPTTVYAVMFDAPINEGNSGGALFNSEGKLVGITTFKYKNTQSEAVFGLFGALPINYFDKVAKYLMIRQTEYARPVLNLELISVNEMGSRRGDYGISSYVTTGAYIKTSTEAGMLSLQENIIIAVNGVQIKSAEDFGAELLKYNVGDQVTITTVNKDGLSNKNTQVVLHGLYGQN